MTCESEWESGWGGSSSSSSSPWLCRCELAVWSACANECHCGILPNALTVACWLGLWTRPLHTNRSITTRLPHRSLSQSYYHIKRRRRPYNLQWQTSVLEAQCPLGHCNSGHLIVGGALASTCLLTHLPTPSTLRLSLVSPRYLNKQAIPVTFVSHIIAASPSTPMQSALPIIRGRYSACSNRSLRTTLFLISKWVPFVKNLRLILAV
jgi:hypothetical protein